MIQRKQTLWLLLAIAAYIITFFLPVYSGTRVRDTSTIFESLTAGSTFLLLVSTVVAIVFTLIIILLFKSRKLQLRLCLVAILFSIGIIALYYIEIGHFNQGNLSLYALLLIIPIASYILAYSGIRKDEKLIKSLDRLR